MTTLIPKELITAKWLPAVSWGNPVTYILEGCRYMMAGTSSVKFYFTALIIFSATTMIFILFAPASAKRIRV